MSGRDALSGSGSIAAATRLFQRFENIQVGVVTVRIDLTLLKCLHHRTTRLMAVSAVVIFAVFAVFTHFWKEEGQFVGLHIDQSKLSEDRKSTRLNSSHVAISYAVFCLKKEIIYCTM